MLKDSMDVLNENFVLLPFGTLFQCYPLDTSYLSNPQNLCPNSISFFSSSSPLFPTENTIAEIMLSSKTNSADVLPMLSSSIIIRGVHFCGSQGRMRSYQCKKGPNKRKLFWKFLGDDICDLFI